MIEVEEWTKKNGSIVYNNKLNQIYDGWRWVDKMIKFQYGCTKNKMVRLFGEERGTYLWESFVDPKKGGRSIFTLYKHFMTPLEINKFSLNLEFNELETCRP